MKASKWNIFERKFLCHYLLPILSISIPNLRRHWARCFGCTQHHNSTVTAMQWNESLNHLSTVSLDRVIGDVLEVRSHRVMASRSKLFPSGSTTGSCMISNVKGQTKLEGGFLLIWSTAVQNKCWIPLYNLRLTGLSILILISRRNVMKTYDDIIFDEHDAWGC